MPPDHCPTFGEAGRSRVVIARDARVRSTGTGFESGPLAQLLDRALQASFDCDSPIEAWKKVVRPGEVVGLKVNCLGGRGNATHPELVEAIIERLRQAGITEIVIWDRQNSDLEHARFKIVETVRESDAWAMTCWVLRTTSQPLAKQAACCAGR